MGMAYARSGDISFSSLCRRLMNDKVEATIRDLQNPFGMLGRVKLAERKDWLYHYGKTEFDVYTDEFGEHIFYKDVIDEGDQGEGYYIVDTLEKVYLPEELQNHDTY